ncbi:MAG: tetratricopeptide repeat protein [Phycisphaerae bacterium]|nr:tetratricopeptide repeat protein [Phycisphaerae bacterium]
MTKPRDKVLKARLLDDIGDVEALTEYVAFLLQNDRVAEAGKWVDRSLAAAPESAGVHVVSASWLLAAERFDEALLALSRAEALGAPPSVCAVARAHHAIATGSPETALGWYEQVMLLLPDDDELRFEYATVLLGAEHWDEAQEQFELLLREHPDNVDARLGCAEAYFGLERFERARFLFEQVLREDGDDESAIIGVAESLYALARDDDALRTLEEFIAERPRSTEALDSLFGLYRATGHLTDAVEIGRRLLRIEDDAALRLDVAMILVSLDRDDEALEQARRALSDHDVSTDARCVLAQIAIRQNRLDEAESQIQCAIDDDPDHSYAFELRSRLRLAQLRPREAREDIEQSLARDPESPSAWTQLAKMSCDAGEFADAVDAAKKAVAIDDTDPNSWALLFLCNLANLDFDAAAKAVHALSAIDKPEADKLRQRLEKARGPSEKS